MTNTLATILSDRKLVLASGSPRRREFMDSLGIPYSIRVSDVDESFSDELRGAEIVHFLSKLKAKSVPILQDNEIIIAADTIVCLDDKVLNKPADEREAKEMLSMLSGRTHRVITGVTLRSMDKCCTFYVSTDVTFESVAQEDIEYYVELYKPYDKAGAYAIQQWIGEIGIGSISGSYSNVVGLPMAELYKELKNFVG